MHKFIQRWFLMVPPSWTIALHTSDSCVRDGQWNSYHNLLVTVKTLFRNIFIYFTPQRPHHSPCKLCMAASMIQVYSTRLHGQDSQQQRPCSIIKTSQQQNSMSHQHRSSRVGCEIKLIQIHFLKYFLPQILFISCTLSGI